MSDIEITALDTATIGVGDVIEIDVGLDNVNVTTENSGIVDVEPHEYFLTSSGIYTGRLNGSIPIWLQNAIQQELTVGEGNITNVVEDLRQLLNTLEIGVNQNLTSIQTTNQSLAALETSVVSRLDGNDAAILNVDTTKVTATEAQTIALSLQQSTFGPDVSAYITSLAATYTDQNSAIAQNMDLLVASINGVSASVSEVSVVSVEEGQARAKHSLVVNAQGNISGYVAESGTTSTFEILADTFKVSNGTTKLPVFTVDTANQIIYAAADIKSSPYSWNNGTPIGFGLFRTGDLDSGKSYNFVGGKYYGSIITAGTVISTNFNGNVSGSIGTPTAGFRLSSQAEGTFSDPTIYGAYVRGGTIYGTNIESANLISSTIKVKDLIVTTDAGYTTDSIVSSQAINLARDSNSFDWVSWGYYLYAYNNPTNTPRLAGTSVRYQATGSTSFRALNGNGTDYIDITYNGWVLLIGKDDTATMNVAVKVGTTTIASSNIASGTTVTLAGIKFRNHVFTSDGAPVNALWVEPIGTITGIAGTTGNLNIYVTSAGIGNLGIPYAHYMSIYNL